MNKQFIKYPSLKKFKDLKKSATSRKFVGLADNEPQFEDDTPTLEFEGTVKMHGTHASIVYWRDGEVTYQSRNRILTPQNDNHGFATAMSGQSYKIPSVWFEDDYILQAIMFDGEWCGGNIQGGVALSGAEKQFIVTNVSKVYMSSEGKFQQHFFNYGLGNICPFKSIKDFKTYSTQVDFNDPEAYTKLMEKTLEVEENCPVGAEINPDSECNIGEGIVWTCTTAGYENNPEWWMKVKGTKHERAGGGLKKSQSDEPLTVEQEALKEAFCKQALTVDRLEQGIEYLQEMEFELSQKSTGHYLKWFLTDVAKEVEEEALLCYASGLTWKGHLCKWIQSDAKNYFFDRLEK